jgi:hypothetical protein
MCSSDTKAGSLAIELTTDAEGAGRCAARLSDVRMLQIQTLITEFRNGNMASVKLRERLIGLRAFCTQVVLGAQLYIQYFGRSNCGGRS